MGTDGFAALSTLPPTSRVRLTIEGREIVLRVDHERTDPKRRFRHVSALADDGSATNALFTVDEATGEIEGTITTTDSVFRLVPETAGAQRVFRTDRASSAAAAGAGGRPDEAGLPRTSQRLARAHRNLKWLQNIQPYRARIEDEASSMLIQGGYLGRLDSNSPDAILAAIKTLSGLITEDEDVRIRVTAVLGTSTGQRIVRFEQLIDGIPVARRNEIRVDARGGISEVTLSLVDQTDSAGTPLPEARAFQLALGQMAFEGRTGAGEPVRKLGSRLEYQWAGRARDLVPVYRFSIRAARGKNYRAEVNGFTGEVRLSEDLQGIVGQQFRHKVCREDMNGQHGNPPLPTMCGQAHTTPIWSETTNVVFGQISYTCHQTGNVQTNPCYSPEHAVPNAVIGSVNAAWENATVNSSGTCCNQVGGNDDTVGVIVDSQVSTGPAYSPADDTIYLPTNADNPDAVAHEMGHAYQNAYGPTLSTGSGLSSGVAEATADVLTAIGLNRLRTPARAARGSSATETTDCPLASGAISR